MTKIQKRKRSNQKMKKKASKEKIKLMRILNKSFNPDSSYDMFEPTFIIKDNKMKVSELKKCPENEFYYTEQNEKDIENLVRDYKDRMSKGAEFVNTDAIHVCPKTKIIWSGHNRFEAAIRADAKYVRVCYADYVYDKRDLNETQIKEILQHFNKLKRNEQGLSNLFLKIESISTNGKLTKKQKDKFCEDWNLHIQDLNALISINTIPDKRKRNKVIKDLDNLIPTTKELKKVILLAKQKKPKKPKKFFPWVRYYLKHPYLLKETLLETVLKMKVEMLLTDSRTSRPHKKHWGQKAITPLVSHTINDSHCATERLHGTIGKKCEMESAPLNSDDKKEQYDFDLYFPALKRHGFDYELEVKSKSDKTEKDCFVFGPGGSRIETPKPYIFVEYNKEMTKFYLMFAMILGKDIKSSAFDINKYINSHKENKDFILVHGEVEDNKIKSTSVDIKKLKKEIKELKLKKIKLKKAA